MEYFQSNTTLPLSSFAITTNDDPTLQTISLTLFVSGCIRKCKKCQNPDLQSIDYSKIISIEEIKSIIKSKLCLIKSISFCGGDFLPLYEKQLFDLCIFSKNNNLKTILYTGELYENINNELKNILDIIIDGPYDCENKNEFIFPASKNQRCFINKKLIEDISSIKINTF